MGAVLRDCPFCGYWAEFNHKPVLRDEGRYWSMSVGCTNCEATMQDDVSWHEEEPEKKLQAQLTEKWNRRTDNATDNT